jgi:ribonuclease P protein component
LAVLTAKSKEGALRRLKNRSEFVGVARGKRVGRSAFSLQANDRDLAEPGIGFTVTKQMGNSPERNRIRRRLRAVAKACADGFAPQHDYVLVGRREALSMPFGQLVDELAASISKIHLKKKS